jgi:hypothetical protein
MKKVYVLLVFILVSSLLLSACSARAQARWKGTISLGDLPSDMLYVNGVPQIITISTESDGDVVMAYFSSDGKVYAQLYGCAVVNLTCSKLYMQGRYEWTIPVE